MKHLGSWSSHPVEMYLITRILENSNQLQFFTFSLLLHFNLCSWCPTIQMAVSPVAKLTSRILELRSFQESNLNSSLMFLCTTEPLELWQWSRRWTYSGTVLNEHLWSNGQFCKPTPSFRSLQYFNSGHPTTPYNGQFSFRAPNCIQTTCTEWPQFKWKLICLFSKTVHQCCWG